MEEEANRKYLDEHVKPILDRLIVDIIIKKPKNALEFMKEWLEIKGPLALQKQLSPSPSKKSRKKLEESGSEEEDEEDTLGELGSKEELAKLKQHKNSRTSVSAEVYGTYNKKAIYVPAVVPKTPEQKSRIKLRLGQSFMFSALDEKEQEIVIDAMQEKIFPVGSVIIEQGDPHGDMLYVVDSGSLDCYKKLSKDAEPKLLKTYVPGESFGELALLYNAPRAATIKVTQQATLFLLDRECFNSIVKDAATKKREKYEEFLAKMDILSTMDAYERSKISDALKPVKFKKGDVVVKEGDKGDTFYFIEIGKAIATKQLTPGTPAQTVYSYKEGDYFGELALLRDTPRAASVIAETDLQLVALDRFSFKRLLGPLEDLLKRNFAKYELFAK